MTLPVRKEYMAWAALGIYFLLLCLWIWKKGLLHLDSDMSSEMMLAKFLHDHGGGIFSRDWYYSTEIRTFDLHLLFQLLFSFSDDWRVVRAAGSILWWLLLLVAFRYYCRQIEMQRYYPYMALALFMPLSIDYFHFTYFGIYYLPHIIQMFLTMGMLFQYLRARKHSPLRWALLGLIGLSALSMGVSGLRYLLFLCIPLLLLSICVSSLPDTASCPRQCKTDVFRLSAMIAFLNLLGNRLGNWYFQKLEYTDTHWTKLSWEGLLDVLRAWLEYLGYLPGEKIFSWALLHNACSFLLILSIVCSVAYILRHRKDFPLPIYLHTLYFLLASIAFAMLYTFTDMQYGARYYSIIYVFAIPVVASCLSKKRDMLAIGSRRLACVLMAGMVLCGYHTFSTAWKTGHVPSKADDVADILIKRNYFREYEDAVLEQKRIADMLIEKHYFRGYASFWHGNVLTELSNGKIEVWVIDDFFPLENNTFFLPIPHGASSDRMPGNDPDLHAIHGWLQQKSHVADVPAAPVFFLASRDEWRISPLLQGIGKDRILYQSDRYIVFGFANDNEINDAFHQKREGNEEEKNS